VIYGKHSIFGFLFLLSSLSLLLYLFSSIFSLLLLLILCFGIFVTLARGGLFRYFLFPFPVLVGVPEKKDQDFII
jgi:hypothetical protein